MPITKPMLPPRAGYVEVVDANGNHVYKPTAETEKKLRAKERESAVQSDIDAITVDHEFRITLLELGVTNDAV